MAAMSETIREQLEEAFQPPHLEVIDESHRHAGHAGAGGGGHFAVTIVSARFERLDTVSRHRLVYRALGGAMGTGIHALALETLTPEEWRSRGERPTGVSTTGSPRT